MSTTRVFKQIISYSLSKNGIHLINDESLHTLIKENPKQGISQLVKTLKEHFKTETNRELKISDESFKTEIWGHYFFEKIYIPFRGILKLLFLNKVVNRLDLSLQEYDCGELFYDPNRWIWDVLSSFNRLFSLFMQDKENLK